MFHSRSSFPSLVLRAILASLSFPLIPAVTINHASINPAQPNSKHANHSEGGVIHIPIRYREQEFRLQMLIGSSLVEYEPALDLASGPTWVSAKGGYNMKGHNLHGIIPDLHYGYVNGPRVSGPVWQDQVLISGRGSDGKPILLDHSTQFVVSNTSGDLADLLGSKGLSSSIGLAYEPQSGHIDKPLTLFESLMKAGHLEAREFAFYCPPLSAGHNATGQLTLGGRDPDKYVGAVTKTPVTVQQAWRHTIDDIAGPNGQRLHLDESFRAADVDSGQNGFSTLITPAMYWHQLIPGAKLAQVNNSYVQGDASASGLKDYRNGSDIGGVPFSEVPKVSFAVPCNLSQADVPKVILGGKELQMRVDELVVHDEDRQHLEEGMCRSSLEGFQTDAWGFGQPWMRSFYTILDWGNDTNGTKVGKGATVGYAHAAPYKPYVEPTP